MGIYTEHLASSPCCGVITRSRVTTPGEELPHPRFAVEEGKLFQNGSCPNCVQPLYPYAEEIRLEWRGDHWWWDFRQAQLIFESPQTSALKGAWGQGEEG